MKLKRDTKFGDKSTCCFKIGVRNLTNFTLIGSFSGKYVLFELKKYRGAIFHDIEE